MASSLSFTIPRAQLSLEEQIAKLSIEVERKFSEASRVIAVARSALDAGKIALAELKSSSRDQVLSASKATLEVENLLAEISLLDTKLFNLTRKEEDLNRQLFVSRYKREVMIPVEIAETKAKFAKLKKACNRLSLQLEEEPISLKKLVKEVVEVTLQFKHFAKEAVVSSYLEAQLRTTYRCPTFVNVMVLITLSVKDPIEKDPALLEAYSPHFERIKNLSQEINDMIEGNAPYKKHAWQKLKE